MASSSAERVVSDRKLTPADFDRIARERGKAPQRARKTGSVAATRAEAATNVDTHWNGKETSNVAKPGDWIVTALGPDRQPLIDRDGNRNVYVIVQERFGDLYERDAGRLAAGDIYRPKAVVEVLPLPSGFDILAPWGERQVGSSGYLIRNGDDVYGNNADTFAATYEIL